MRSYAEVATAAGAWAERWINSVADGKTMMSQRKLNSIDRHGGGIEPVTAAAQGPRSAPAAADRRPGRATRRRQQTRSRSCVGSSKFAHVVDNQSTSLSISVDLSKALVQIGNEARNGAALDG